MKPSAARSFIVAVGLCGWLAVATAAGEPAPAAGTVWRDCSDCPEMVSVPAGRFTMGGNTAEHAQFGVTPDYAATELPAHDVHLARPIAVGRFAVTRDEWARYVAADAGRATATAHGCAVLTPATGGWAVGPARSWRDPGFAQTGRHPAVCIDWNEAKAYAAWLSARTGLPYRLLSEAEWEYAARAGTGGANYWGNERDNACAFANTSDLTRTEQHAYSRSVPGSAFLCHDGHVFTAPVDAFAANAFGLYGMSGTSGSGSKTASAPITWARPATARRGLTATAATTSTAAHRGSIRRASCAPPRGTRTSRRPAPACSACAWRAT